MFSVLICEVWCDLCFRDCITRYLELYFVMAKYCKCSLDQAKRSFHRAYLPLQLIVYRLCLPSPNDLSSFPVSTVHTYRWPAVWCSENKRHVSLVCRNIIRFNLTSSSTSLQAPGLFVDAQNVKYFNTANGKDAVHRCDWTCIVVLFN